MSPGPAAPMEAVLRMPPPAAAPEQSPSVLPAASLPGISEPTAVVEEVALISAAVPMAGPVVPLLPAPHWAPFILTGISMPQVVVQAAPVARLKYSAVA